MHEQQKTYITGNEGTTKNLENNYEETLIKIHS